MTQTCEHGQLLLSLKRFVSHVPYKFASVYLLSFPLSLLLNTSSYILVSILDGPLSRTCCGYYFYNFSFLALRRWHDFSLSSLLLKGEGFYIPEGDINSLCIFTKGTKLIKRYHYLLIYFYIIIILEYKLIL